MPFSRIGDILFALFTISASCFDILNLKMTNKVIENYVLKDRLGSGQYGNVFMAEDQKSKSVVAVKVMHVQKFKMTPKLSEFTSNEISILTKISSSHIIKFIEMLRTMNNYYLVYEYCNGGTLAQLLEKRKILKEPEALKIFAQMVEAFRVLVKENILHRDLKPTNILFHDGVIKLADFGFCKELMKETDMTQTMVGSPIYMAPEILKGQIYNCKADVWSMGVVLYQMLFGVCPFEEKSIAKLVSLIDNSSLHIPLKVNPISESTQQLLKKILVVDVNKRISPQQLINYKLNIVVNPQQPIKIPDRTEEICRFNRENIEYITETLYGCAEQADTKDRLTLTFLLYKLIASYQRDIRRKSRYWTVVKVGTLHEQWDNMVNEELERLNNVRNLVKESLLKSSPSIKLKIELETDYPDLKFLFDSIEPLRPDALKLRLLNSLLIYKHIYNVLERNEVSLEKIVVPAEEAALDSTIQKKLEKCRQFLKNQL